MIVKTYRIMKTLARVLFAAKAYALSLLLVSCASMYPVSVAPQQGYVSFQVFYDDLSPYGQWVDYPDYGYVWIPDAGPDFFPYLTNGYWGYTEFGWTWISNYSWGWAPFHYGRWDFDDYYGWFWVPDNVWGPCWVTWRRADGYFGWAPMRPGISVELSFGTGYRDPNRWCFVRQNDFARHDLSRYYINRRDNDRILGSSVVITNSYVDPSRNVRYSAGPRRDDIQRFTGRRITEFKVRDNAHPGIRVTGNALQIYRPQIERAGNGHEAPAPRNITNLNDIRRKREAVNPAEKQSNTAIERNAVTPSENNRRQVQERPGKQVTNEPPAVIRPNSREIQKPAPGTVERRQPEQIQQPGQENQVKRNDNNRRAAPKIYNSSRGERHSSAESRKAARESRRGNRNK
jgi:hypothetical protein